MSGAIRTKERCPVCAQPYGEKFECPAHYTFPTRFYIDLSWKGKRLKIYSDRQGDPLDSFRRAVKLQTEIDDEIKAHVFDPLKYLNQEKQNFYTQALLSRFQDAKTPTLAPSYQNDYRRMITEASGFFLKKDARELRKLDLINYQNHLKAKGIQGKYQKNYLDLFKTFLRWCKADLEILDVVPSFPPVQVQARPFRWLGREDQIKIFQDLPAEDRPIISFLMLHGCRPAEARALRIGDLDLKNRTVTISSTFSRTVLREQRKGRGAQPMTIPIHPECYDFIAGRARLALPSAFVFINPRSNKPYGSKALERVWRRLRVKAELPANLRLYDATRHSVATQLRLAGVPLADIKDQLGHSDIRTTMRYAHGDIEKLRENLEKLSLVLIRPQTGPEEKTAGKS